MPKAKRRTVPSSEVRETPAPSDLTEAQNKQVHEWAERKLPWVSRGAFESFTPIDEYIDAALDWFAGDGRHKKDWARTVQTWIRKAERRRLESFARRGDENAALALREPAEWARRYDRKQEATRLVSSSGGEALISPTGGTVLKLTSPPRDF